MNLKPQSKLTSLFVIFILTFSNVALSEETPQLKKDTQSSNEYLSHVPNLVGKPLDEVKKLLPDYILKLGNVTQIPSDIPEGTIIAQSEAAFTDVKQDTAIDLTVSSGSQSLNSVKIDSQENPTELLSTTTTPSKDKETPPSLPSTEEITSLSSQLSPTNTAETAATIESSLQKESEKTTSNDQNDTNSSVFLSFVPDLIGLTKEEAKTRLPEHSLILGETTEKQSDQAAGTIIAQSEQANTNIPQNSIVHITIAINPDEKTKEADGNEATQNIEESGTAETAQLKDEPANSTAQTEAGSQEEDKPSESTPSPLTQTTSSSDNVDTADKPSNKEGALSNENIDSLATSSKQESPTNDDDTIVSNAANDKAIVEVTSEKGLQSKRNISFTIIPPEKLANEPSLNYHLSISGKIYKQNTPIFTHQFERADKVIVTGSVRIPGKKWFHSNSQQLTINEYKAIKIKVPNVVGLSEADARQALKNKDLKVGNIQQKRLDGKTGIIEQRPKAGIVLNEDNNIVHLVKAIGQKYKVDLSSNKTNIEETESISFNTQITPKPSNQNIEYRFIVNRKTYRNDQPKWEHTFNQSGNYTILVKALIQGEGTFESQIMDISVNTKWTAPIATIQPPVITLEKGKLATFNNASTSKHINANLQVIWTDPFGQTHTENTLKVDTSSLQAGKHIIKLTVKDKEGETSQTTASLLIRPSSQIAPNNQSTNQTEAVDDELQQILAEEAIDTNPTIQETEVTPSDNQTVNTSIDPNIQTTTVQKEAASEPDLEDNASSVQKSLNDNNNFSFWLWMSILAILFYAIFWFLRKLK